MAIVKRGMLDWPGNDEKMTSYSNLTVSFSEILLNVVRGFLFVGFGMILEVSLPEVII